MQINVNVIDASGNTRRCTTPAGETVGAVLQQLGYNVGNSTIRVNQAVADASTPLNVNSTITIVPNKLGGA